MTDEAGRPLAEVFAAWVLLRGGLTVAQIQRGGGVARHTVERIRAGSDEQPRRATLRAVAVGIIRASSGTLGYDARIMADCYRDLSLAAGYGDPTAAEARSLLDLALYYELRSPARAHAWAALIRQLRAVEPERLWALFEDVRCRQGDDVSIE